MSILTASIGFSPIASTTRPEMKKAAPTLSSGISATSAQPGRGRSGAFIVDSPPRTYGEGSGVGRAPLPQAANVQPAAKSPTPDPSPQEAGRGEGARTPRK